MTDRHFTNRSFVGFRRIADNATWTDVAGIVRGFAAVDRRHADMVGFAGDATAVDGYRADVGRLGCRSSAVYRSGSRMGWVIRHAAAAGHCADVAGLGYRPPAVDRHGSDVDRNSSCFAAVDRHGSDVEWFGNYFTAAGSQSCMDGIVDEPSGTNGNRAGVAGAGFNLTAADGNRPSLSGAFHRIAAADWDCANMEWNGGRIAAADWDCADVDQRGSDAAAVYRSGSRMGRAICDAGSS